MQKIAEYYVKKAEIKKILELYDMNVNSIPTRKTFYSNVAYNPEFKVYAVKTAEEKPMHMITFDNEIIKTASATQKFIDTENMKEIDTDYKQIGLSTGAIGHFLNKEANYITEPMRIEQILLQTPRLCIVKTSGLKSLKEGMVVLEEGSSIIKNPTGVYEAEKKTPMLFMPRGTTFVKKASAIDPEFEISYKTKFYLFQTKTASLKLSKENTILKMFQYGIPPVQAQEICKYATQYGKVYVVNDKITKEAEDKNIESVLYKLTKIAEENLATQNETNNLAQDFLESLKEYPSINLETLEQIYHEAIDLLIQIQFNKVKNIDYKVIKNFLIALDKLINTIKEKIAIEELTSQGA